MSPPASKVRFEGMKSRSFPVAAGILFLLAAVLPAQSQKPLPGQGQKKDTQISTPAGKFALEVTADYLGMASSKTVVRLRLASPQLSKALSERGVRFVSGELRGSFSKGAQTVESF